MPHLQLEVSHRCDLPPAQLWPIISDLDAYADHADGLAETRVTDGSGPTAVRSCTDTRGGTWREAVSEWVEGERYTITVDTDTYPAPLRAMFRAFRGTWSVEPDGDGSIVRMAFDADIRGGALGRAMVGPMKRKAEKDVAATLRSYEHAAREAEVDA